MSPSDLSDRRLRLIEQILRLPEDRLAAVERLLIPPSPGSTVEHREALAVSVARDWPHAPTHRLSESGTYIVTSSTYMHDHFFRGPERLDYLESTLLRRAKEAGWQLEAWAVFSNHY